MSKVKQKMMNMVSRVNGCPESGPTGPGLRATWDRTPGSQATVVGNVVCRLGDDKNREKTGNMTVENW